MRTSLLFKNGFLVRTLEEFIPGSEIHVPVLGPHWGTADIGWEAYKHRHQLDNWKPRREVYTEAPGFRDPNYRVYEYAGTR